MEKNFIEFSSEKTGVFTIFGEKDFKVEIEVFKGEFYKHDARYVIEEIDGNLKYLTLYKNTSKNSLDIEISEESTQIKI